MRAVSIFEMEMIKFKLYRQQYRQNLLLAGPIVMSQVGQVMVQLADNMMIGWYNSLSLAAVSFGGSVFFIIFVLGMGFAMGATPLVGESYTTSKHKRSSALLQNSLLLYFLIGILLCALLWAIVPLMSHMGQEKEVVELAVPYYKYISCSVIPFMIFAGFKQFLEGIGNTKVAMLIVIVSNLINIVFNYVFIFGKFGAPEMGAAGAGLSTLISRICMPIFMLAYFLHADSFRRYFRMFRRINFDMKPILDLFRVGAPISLQMFMETSAFAITSIMMGWISTTALAANQVTMSLSNFSFMIIIGIGAATTIRVSHEYGRGNLRGMRMAASAAYHIGIAYNIITVTLFILLRKYLPMMFTDDAEVITISSHLLIFAAMFQICDGLQLISLSILRGMKDVNYTIFVAFISYIVINLPFGYLLAFTLNTGPGGLWIGIVVGLSIAALMLNMRYRRRYRELRTVTLRY